MAAQGEGDQSSSHIINKKKASADRHAGFEEFMTPPTPVENKGRYPFSLAFRVLISIAEQFCRKFALYKRKDCLSLEENECLWAVFEHFSVQHDGDLYWTESTFASFLTCLLPVQAKASWWQNATPIMYKLFRQLGSYPYQTQPSENTLTFDQMSLAILLLIDGFRYLNVSPIRRSVDNASMPIMVEKFCRLLFQSLTALGPNLTGSNEGSRTRLNDTDLRDAHLILSFFATQGMNDPNCEQRIVTGPKIPDCQDFPSSYSNKLDGRLPTSEIRAWLPLMVANLSPECKDESYPAEADAELLVTRLERKEKQFHANKSASDGAVGLEAFRILTPWILEPFRQIFSPCLKGDWVHVTIWLDKLPLGQGSSDAPSGEERQLALP